MPADTSYTDGTLIWGTQSVTIPPGSTGVAYIAEDISVEFPTKLLETMGTTGLVNKAALIGQPFTGSATLQLADSTTVLPPLGAQFGIISAGAVSVTVTSTTAGAATTVTATAHGLVTGDWVVLSGITTATPSVNYAWRVTVLTSSTFTIPLTTTGTGSAGLMYPALGCWITKVGEAFKQDSETLVSIDFRKRLNA